MAPDHFDLVVVGTGAAASSIAYPCREAGWSVAVIDDRPYGGTCANRGCDPKKVLVGAADVVDWARRMSPNGVAASDLHVDWPQLMRFKHSFTDPVPLNREQAFSAAGMAMFHGTARFTAPDTMEIEGTRVTASHFAIASGAAPAPLQIPGEDLLCISDQFLDFEQLPESLIFVGGGYIAFEFAHLAARAGARVTILHRGQRPLETFDADLVQQLVTHSRRAGIGIELHAAVQKVERSGGGLRVTTARGSFEAVSAIHAAGRRPQLDRLNLPAAGVDFTIRGVTVNDFLQSSSNSRVYAAGDAAASGPPLTPVAGYEGRIVAANLLHGNRERPDYRGVASTVFSLPPLASCGLTEEAARRQGLSFDLHSADTSGWYTSRRVAESCSGFKVLVERPTGRILAAHLLGTGAEEQINLFALAIRHGLTAEQIKAPLYAYPSHSSNTQYMV
jgi:glutathione reductase (NADPH)